MLSQKHLTVSLDIKNTYGFVAIDIMINMTQKRMVSSSREAGNRGVKDMTRTVEPEGWARGLRKSEQNKEKIVEWSDAPECSGEFVTGSGDESMELYMTRR
jgi:hypothetical protein